MDFGDVTFDQKKRLARLAKMGIGPAGPGPTGPGPSARARHPEHQSIERKAAPAGGVTRQAQQSPEELWETPAAKVAKTNRAGLKPLGAVEPREFQSNWYPTPADNTAEMNAGGGEFQEFETAQVSTARVRQATSQGKTAKEQKNKKRKSKRSRGKDSDVEDGERQARSPRCILKSDDV
eukprot:s1003_g1.t1